MLCLIVAYCLGSGSPDHLTDPHVVEVASEFESLSKSL